MSTIPKHHLDKIKDVAMCDYEDDQVNAFKDGAQYGHQLATDGREELEKELPQLLHDVQQILSAYAMDETWTGWDESVRNRVIEMQRKLQDNGNSK